MSSFKFTQPAKNMNQAEANKKLQEPVTFLLHPSNCEPISNLTSSQACYEALYYTGQFIAYQTSLIEYSYFIDVKFHELLGRLLLHLANDLVSSLDFVKDQVTNANFPVSGATDNQRCVDIFGVTVYIINLCMKKHLKFKLEFQKTLGLEAHFKLLSNSDFMAKNSSVQIAPYRICSVVLTNFVVINISSLSLTCQEYKHLWTQVGAVNVLLDLLRKNNLVAKEYLYKTLTYVADDKQLEALTEVHEYSKILIGNFFKNF